MCGAAWERVRRCAAKATAQPRVSHSPRPRPERMAAPELGGMVRKIRPMKASRAPAKVGRPGLAAAWWRAPGMMLRRGTMTTTRPVMRPDLAAVV